ncbi:hypothetical protein BWR13_15380 [Escherichia coli]|nr:hypothetical protein BWR13_15380 [Escherichia coli]
MLRIEPLARLSPRTSHRGAAAPLTHPVGLPSSLKVKGIASGGLTATALSPFAAGELQGLQYAYHAGDCLPVREKVNGGKVKGIASGGLTATALPPFAAGELQGVWCGHQRR